MVSTKRVDFLPLGGTKPNWQFRSATPPQLCQFWPWAWPYEECEWILFRIITFLYCETIAVLLLHKECTTNSSHALRKVYGPIHPLVKGYKVRFPDVLTHGTGDLKKIRVAPQHMVFWRGTLPLTTCTETGCDLPKILLIVSTLGISCEKSSLC